MNIRLTLLSFIIFCILNSYGQDKPIKIACIGNSITYGAGMANPERNAYPKQLQYLLGDSYEVKNFGVNGSTLLNKGDYPYRESIKYKEALLFAPNVVYIMLGTNDSKFQNRKYLDSDFEKDYKTLINSFKNKNLNTRIILLLPVPSFHNDSKKIWNPVIKNKIIPLIQKIASETNSEIIDLYQLFVDEPNMLPDSVHPSSLGASRIANRLYEDIILNTQEQNGFNFPANSNVEQINFFGFTQKDFQLKGVNCKVVEPKRTAKGKPWVLRARFFGHEPQTDIALLERGFHIAYCDVSNLFGNDEAVTRWNSFYEFMLNQGFEKKVVLEGMSRGGLIIYNWAVQNPEKVAGIYADAPVLDGKSWPGGFGRGKGSNLDWEKFKEVYNINSEDELLAFNDNPIDKIESIAEAGFPMIHVCGESDEVVPVDENTRPFEHKLKERGGNITTIYKDNIGHRPHSLKNPTPIVDFILRATNRKVNFAIIPRPGSEYRSAAGWAKGSDWWSQEREIDSICRATKDLDLLLIGNSITQGWNTKRKHATYKPGELAAEAHFRDLKYVSAGISGDRTEHILWRIKNGNYNENSPKMIVLAIGVNNFRFNSVGEIVEGITSVVELAKKEFPISNILLLGMLPTGLNKDSNRRRKYDAIHRELRYLEDKPLVHYFNLSEIFLDEYGNLNESLYSSDGIHLTPKGYDIWGKFLKEKFTELNKAN